jgi:Ca2+/Na+ antiporter
MLFLGLPLGVHRILGAAIGLAALLLSLMAVAGRLSRITRALSNALLLLLIVQPVCVLFGEQIPTLMALHGVNAFLILVLVVVLVLHLEEETAGSRDESWRSPSAP